MAGTEILLANTELLGRIIAAAILLTGVYTVWEVVRRLIKKSHTLATGGAMPLQAKGPNPEKAIPGILIRSMLAPLPRDAFRDERAGMCPLHNRMYCGTTTFSLHLPPQKGALSSKARQETSLGHLHVLGCNECFDEAEKYREMMWRRDNHVLHPVWASAQIYPHLLEDRFVRVVEPCVLFSGELRATVTSAAPAPAGAIAESNDPLLEWAEQLRADLAILASKAEKQDVEHIMLAPEIPAEALAEAIESLLPGMNPNDVIAIYRKVGRPDRWPGGFILGLNHIAWVSNPKKETPVKLSYASIRSIQAGKKEKTVLFDDK